VAGHFYSQLRYNASFIRKKKGRGPKAFPEGARVQIFLSFLYEKRREERLFFREGERWNNNWLALGEKKEGGFSPLSGGKRIRGILKERKKRGSTSSANAAPPRGKRLFFLLQ